MLEDHGGGLRPCLPLTCAHAFLTALGKLSLVKPGVTQDVGASTQSVSGPYSTVPTAWCLYPQDC